jgi:hypothetical protein
METQHSCLRNQEAQVEGYFLGCSAVVPSLDPDVDKSVDGFLPPEDSLETPG